MRRHFYELKNSCTNKNGLELTEELKQNVLQNRVYFGPSKAQYQNINQILGSMEAITKLNHLLDHCGKRLQDANDYFENLHSQTVAKLYDDAFTTPHLVGQDGLMMLVDDLARVNNKNGGHSLCAKR